MQEMTKSSFPGVFFQKMDGNCTCLSYILYEGNKKALSIGNGAHGPAHVLVLKTPLPMYLTLQLYLSHW